MEDGGYLRDPEEVRLIPGTVEALAKAKSHGFKTVIVTNQSGLGRGYFTETDYKAVHARLMELVGPELIDAAYFCPDHPDRPTARRKPEPGMLLEAARELELDLGKSWMIGDRATDLETGRRAGVPSILVLTGLGAQADSSGAITVAKNLSAAVDFILETTDCIAKR